MSTFEKPASELPNEASRPEEITRFVVEAAVSAPSVLNTQPWWFYGVDHEIGLHADAERKLQVADPDGREMMISCGAALFTARVALRYLGIVPKVQVLPEPSRPAMVAKINWTEGTPPVDYERELFADIPRRRTHRGGFDPEPVPHAIVTAARAEAAKENVTLRIINDQAERDGLAVVVEAGEYALRRDSARAREQAKWAMPPGSKKPEGVPATAYPARPERVEPNYPARDFAHGRSWGLPPTGESAQIRSAGVVAILSTGSDRPLDWVSAGQALQRVLLFLTGCGLVAALNTQPLEVPQLRDFIRIHFCEGANPQMILRFGATGQTEVSVRRPVQDVLL